MRKWRQRAAIVETASPDSIVFPLANAPLKSFDSILAFHGKSKYSKREANMPAALKADDHHLGFKLSNQWYRSVTKSDVSALKAFIPFAALNIDSDSGVPRPCCAVKCQYRAIKTCGAALSFKLPD